MGRSGGGFDIESSANGRRPSEALHEVESTVAGPAPSSEEVGQEEELIGAEWRWVASKALEEGKLQLLFSSQQVHASGACMRQVHA